MSSDPNEREKVLDILTNYGLEMEDLAVLADMPEELLTAETIPHLLVQIRKHRNAPEPHSPPLAQCPTGGRDPPPFEPITLLPDPACPSPAPHHTLLLHSYAELNPILPAYSAAESHPSLPNYSPTVSHHTIPMYSSTASNLMHGTYSFTESPRIPSTHSNASTQNMLLTAPSAPAPGPSRGSQDTLRTPPAANSSSPANVLPPAGSPPKVAGISFTISRPEFPTKVEPPMSTPPPGRLSDYRGGAPDKYPYRCSLCSYQAVNQEKWLGHLYYMRHVKGRIALLKRYPHWVFDELKNVKPTPLHQEEQATHVQPLEMLCSNSSTSESSSSLQNDRSSQRTKSQHDDKSKESDHAKLPAESSDLKSKKTRETYHGCSSTTLLFRKRQKSSEEEDNYGTNRRKEETRRRRRESSSEEEYRKTNRRKEEIRRRRRESSSEEEASYRTNWRKEERRRRGSSSEEEDRYRRRDDESSRRRRRRAESSERGNSKVDRFGRDITGRDGSPEGSAKRRRSRGEEDKHGRKTEEKRARQEDDRKRRTSGGNKDGEKNTPIQPVANTSSAVNKKSLEGESRNKKEREGSSRLPREGFHTTREKGSDHIGDIAKNKDIVGTKETQKRHEGQEKAVLDKGVTRMSADTNRTKEDQQPFPPEMPPPVHGDLHGARTQEEQVPSMNAGHTGSAAREKLNEETIEEPGERPVPPEEPSNILTGVILDRCQTTTSAEQHVCGNTDPVKNLLDSSNCRGAEKEKEKEKEDVVKEQEHKTANSKSADLGSAQSIIPREGRQTGSHLVSVSEAEPSASGSESQSEAPETASRRGQRRKASDAPAVDRVPRTTRKSARILGSPPPEPDPQPGPRGALPEQKPTEEEGSGGREAKKRPSPVGVGNLPKKKSEGQKLTRKSSDAETADRAKNGDDDEEEEAPDSVVGMKASAVDPTEEQGTVRGTVSRGQSRRCPLPQRSKKPAARRTRGGTFTSSEDPTDHTVTDTQTHAEARQEAGEVRGEDKEPLVLKEAPPDLTPEPSSTANIVQKDSTEAAPTKKTEPTLEKHPGPEAGSKSEAHKVIYGSSAAADMGPAQPPQTMGEIVSQLDNRGEASHEENNDLSKENEKEREPVESHQEEGDETETCDLVKPAEEEEVKMNTEPVENSLEPHGKVKESQEEVVELGADRPQLGRELTPPEPAKEVELGEEVLNPKRVAESKKSVMELWTDPPHPVEELKPREPAKEVPEPKAKVLQSESVLVVELGEVVLKPKRVLESKKSVMELGAEPQHPGEEPPQPGEAELKIGRAPPTEEEAGFAERDPDLEDLDDPVGTEFIHPVTGFYCSLCQVVYSRETEAKEGHCRSPSHRRMVQAHAGSKL